MYRPECAARKDFCQPERRSLLSESETRARSVRKYVCDIVHMHMQVSLIIVTRDL